MDRKATAWRTVTGTLLAALVLVLLAGCASSRDPGSEADDHPAGEQPTGERPTADVDEILAEKPAAVCVREATVTVHVWNDGSAAVRLSFGSYSPARATEAFSRSTYNVARSNLRYPVVIRVERGGLQMGGPSRIQTEPVVCNTATLVIGARPRFSVFYGDAIYGTSDLLAADSLESEAQADSTSNRDSGEG